MQVAENDWVDPATLRKLPAPRLPTSPDHHAGRATARPRLNLFTTEPAGNVRVAHVLGEVDLATGSRLRWYLLDQVASAPHSLVVDLSGVSFLAVRGLAVLQETARACHERGTHLSVVVARTPAARLFELFPLDGVSRHAFLHDALNHSFERGPTD